MESQKNTEVPQVSLDDIGLSSEAPSSSSSKAATTNWFEGLEAAADKKSETMRTRAQFYAEESNNNWITTSVITKNPVSLEALCQLEHLVMTPPFFVPAMPS